jgi:hypothetical protein
MSVKRRSEEPVQVKVNPADEASLSVISNGHIGSSTVKFRFTSDILGQGEIKDLVIGKGNAIAGKTLRVATRVLIASPNKKIVVTHELKNAEPPEFIYRDEVGDNHDVFTLVADYIFTT